MAPAVRGAVNPATKYYGRNSLGQRKGRLELDAAQRRMILAAPLPLFCLLCFLAGERLTQM